MGLHMDEKQVEVVESIKKVLDDLRPFLNMDGGDVEFLKYEVESKTVFVKLSGACAMCMMQDETLELGLLDAIKEKVPEVQKIINSPL